MHGIDGMRMVMTTNLEEGVIMAAALRRAQELAADRDEALAVNIRNQLVEAWNKGRK